MILKEGVKKRHLTTCWGQTPSVRGLTPTGSFACQNSRLDPFLFPNIGNMYSWGANQLKNLTDIPELESRILLAHTLDVSQTYLFTRPEKQLQTQEQDYFLELVKRRQSGEPIAYITGRKEFWSLGLIVTPDVLIPRPETELLVECVLEKITREHAIIADLGTGSGAIALALAHERPCWQLHATDISNAALSVAKENKTSLGIQSIEFHLGSWCQALPSLPFDAIVTNPPYIGIEDSELSPNVLKFEPRSALLSADEGLNDIRQIVHESRQYLKPSGLLFIEHGARQAKKVASILEQAGYTEIDTVKDPAGLDRVTIASWHSN